VRAAAIQTGSASGDFGTDLRAALDLIHRLDPTPDLVVLPELFTRPFWCVGLSDARFLEWAEPVDGATVTAMRGVARDIGAHIVVPFFERGAREGEYYNSAALVAPSGELVPGRLPSGETVLAYRKHVISAYRWGESVNDEKFYFRPGPGFPIFETEIGTIGLLICYDRWFPEAWRVLALQGARIICVPNASAGVGEMFAPLVRTCAAQNVVFAVAVNRTGAETVDGITNRYFGSSCIVDPAGKVLAQAETEAGALCAELDLAATEATRTQRTMYRDRRPELYGPIAGAGA
jgi:predicted amidohydrolase